VRLERDGMKFMITSPDPGEAVSLHDDLEREYQRRFLPLQEYRKKVWSVLIRDFFQKYIVASATVLDLGCGWGEFINQVQAGRRIGMDLNPDSPAHLAPAVEFCLQDCSLPWQLPENSLDVIFTSNFFEHLPNKIALKQTLAHACKALRPGGKIICLGPNIKFLPGTYWDFWDHEVPLTELSLREILEISGFRTLECLDRFLPYTMVGGSQPPLWQIQLYLKLPFVWKLLGKQFLLVAEKSPSAES
jgi:SAM-dependent methyltransferase